MQATLTNLGSEALPLTSSHAGGLAVLLQPGEPYILDNEDITVATVGDNPSFLEDFQEAVGELAEKVKQIILFWQEHKVDPHGSDDPQVKVRIVAGANAIRVTSDDRSKDTEVVPGSLYDAEAPNYVELRQLGV